VYGDFSLAKVLWRRPNGGKVKTKGGRLVMGRLFSVPAGNRDLWSRATFALLKRALFPAVNARFAIFIGFHFHVRLL
jgi:hypothetical protein